MDRGMNGGGASLFRRKSKVMINRLSNIKFEQILHEGWVDDEREWLALG